MSWLLFPMIVLLGFSAVGSYYLAYEFAYIAYDRSLADNARALAGQTTVVNGQVKLDLPGAAKKMLLSDEYDTVYFKIKGADGVLIDGNPDLPDPEVARYDGVPVMHDASLHGKKLRIASRFYVPPGGQAARPILVQVAETLNKRKILEREILAASVLPQLALIGAALLALWMGVSRGLRPMESLHNEIAARSHNDLSPIEEGHTPREMQPIIYAVNDLMSRLESALVSQQRFIADAAHQLRTPVAGMKTQIGLTLGQTDNKSLQHSLQQLNNSAGRIGRLVNQMLDLAQVEPDANKAIVLKSVDLTKIVKSATMEWVPLALKRNLDLGFEGPEKEIIIQGNALRIKMLLDNLIDNAVRYSPQGGSITTRLENSDEVTLSVEDSGSGVPAEERSLVFQRFYRILGNDAEGCGLGLSIARGIADLHRAKIFIDEPKTHKGTLIKVIFPKA